MKKLIVILTLILSFSSIAYADQEWLESLYEKSMQAVQVLENLGDDGLAAFDDPKGEFVWGDGSMVGVTDCKKGLVAASPRPGVKGLTMDMVKDYKTGRLIMTDFCNSTNPKGYWTDAWWPDAKTGKLSRSLVFGLPVPNSRYTIWATISGVGRPSVEEMNKSLP